MRRDAEALRKATFDLLVLGGGITGAGVALDAALRGLRVALIDKGDFASGTSSVSSKLVHGGLRYLEHAQFRLVYEALHERRLLLHNAPHLVRPLRFLLPFYRGARLRPWQWRLGLTLYDLLAGPGNIRRSRPLSALEISRILPGLRRAGLLGGAEYFDAQMDDARLCLEVVLSAAKEGARVCNYVEARGFEWAGGRIIGVQAFDHLAGRELLVRARQVVNATGPWLDEICRLAGDTSGPKLEPTKGVHAIAPGHALPAALLLLHPADGRVFFVIPWMGKTLLGTTDTLTPEGPDALQVNDKEIAYLLEGHNYYLEPTLRPADLCGRFAGLRPLLRGGSEAPSARSREFRLFSGPGSLLSAAGGKYTTYRHMAEILTDEVMRRLGRRCPSRTRHHRLDGTPLAPWPKFAPAATARLLEQHDLSPESARHLVNRYGRHAFDVAAYLEHAPKLAESIVPGEPDVRAELPYQRDQELAFFAADHFLRRTRLGLFHPELLTQDERSA
jgi:glycerol-3-phosphate dehydrogenase